MNLVQTSSLLLPHRNLRGRHGGALLICPWRFISALIDGLWRWGCDNPRQSPQELGNPVLGLGERTSDLKWRVDTAAHLKVTLFLSVPKGTLQSLQVNPHLSINRSANQVSDQISSSFLHQST